MHVAVQYAPYHRKDGASWDAAAKNALGDRVVAMLEELAPGFASSIVARAVHSPLDLEQRFGLREGHVHGGELGLDQILFMRPLPGFAHYRSPIEGLFMCGEACHPGGALPGWAGANAAREILKGA
jgi:phytoene dehydrogenase-like protein